MLFPGNDCITVIAHGDGGSCDESYSSIYIETISKCGLAPVISTILAHVYVDSTLESGEGFLYGAGVNINIYNNKDRMLRVEWEHHEFDNITLDNVDTVSVSAIFQF